MNGSVPEGDMNSISRYHSCGGKCRDMFAWCASGDVSPTNPLVSTECLASRGERCGDLFSCCWGCHSRRALVQRMHRGASRPERAAGNRNTGRKRIR